MDGPNSGNEEVQLVESYTIQCPLLPRFSLTLSCNEAGRLFISPPSIMSRVAGAPAISPLKRKAFAIITSAINNRRESNGRKEILVKKERQYSIFYICTAEGVEFTFYWTVSSHATPTLSHHSITVAWADLEGLQRLNDTANSLSLSPRDPAPRFGLF